jgi:hypothetical protein
MIGNAPATLFQDAMKNYEKTLKVLDVEVA